MTQTANECFDEWRTAFCQVLELMAVEVINAAPRIVELLESDNEWTQVGAIDGRAFYNDVAGNAVKLKLCEDVDWLGKYFYLKYIEWSRPIVEAS